MAWVTVRGRSMEPFLLAGDRVRCVRVPPGALRPGDLVALRSDEGRVVLHRFVGRRGASLLTRGDNRPGNDPAWPESALLGRVTLVGRGGKWLRPAPGTARILARLGPSIPRWIAGALQQVLRHRAWLPASAPRGQARPAARPPAPYREPDGRPRWEIQRLGDDWAVLDTTTHAVHLLNPLAYAIWTRLAAGLDIRALMSEMEAAYPCVPPSRLAGDVELGITELRRAGLLGNPDR